MKQFAWTILLGLAVAALGCGAPETGVSRAADAPGGESKLDAAEQAGTVEDWSPVFVDLGGREHRPLEQDGVKAVAVVFVTTDCPIANSYLPELNRLHDSFAPRGVPLVLVHSEPETSVEQLRQHAKDYEIQPLVVIDRKLDWARRAGATRTPEAAVFSPAGELLYRGRIDDLYVGFGKRRTEATTHDFQDALEAIVAGRPVPQPRTEAVGCYLPDPPEGE